MIKVTTYDDHIEMSMNGDPADLCTDMEYILKGFIDKFLREAQDFSDDEVIDLMHEMIANAMKNRSEVIEKHDAKGDEFIRKLGDLIDEYKGMVN